MPEFITQIGLSHHIILACAIFFLGFYGVIVSRPILKKFLSTQIMLISVGIILAAISRFNGDISFQGEMFATFIIAFTFIQTFIFTTIKLYHNLEKEKDA